MRAKVTSDACLEDLEKGVALVPEAYAYGRRAEEVGRGSMELWSRKIPTNCLRRVGRVGEGANAGQQGSFVPLRVPMMSSIMSSLSASVHVTRQSLLLLCSREVGALCPGPRSPATIAT